MDYVGLVNMCASYFQEVMYGVIYLHMLSLVMMNEVMSYIYSNFVITIWLYGFFQSDAKVYKNDLYLE